MTAINNEIKPVRKADSVDPAKVPPFPYVGPPQQFQFPDVIDPIIGDPQYSGDEVC